MGINMEEYVQSGPITFSIPSNSALEENESGKRQWYGSVSTRTAWGKIDVVLRTYHLINLPAKYCIYLTRKVFPWENIICENDVTQSIMWQFGAFCDPLVCLSQIRQKHTPLCSPTLPWTHRAYALHTVGKDTFLAGTEHSKSGIKILILHCNMFGQRKSLYPSIPVQRQMHPAWGWQSPVYDLMLAIHF